VWVVGLREGTMLLVEEDKIIFTGPRKARVFRKNHDPLEMGEKDDFSFLFK
jgi:dipeptidase E